MAKIFNLLIEQGASFQKSAIAKIKNGETVSLRPLEGHQGRAQIKKSHKDTSPIATFDVTINPVTSQIRWSLTAEQTALIKSNCFQYQIPKKFSELVYLPESHPLFSSVYVWDLELVLGVSVQRYLQGMVLVTPEVTKQ